MAALPATPTPWPSPWGTRSRCPCPSFSTPPLTPAAKTPSATPSPACRRARPAGRGPLTRKRPLPLPSPPSCPTDSDTPDSATTDLATPDLATLDSATLDSTATPTPLLPLPLLRLRCPSPSTSTCPRSRPWSSPLLARTPSALPSPAPKSEATSVYGQLTIIAGKDLNYCSISKLQS